MNHEKTSDTHENHRGIGNAEEFKASLTSPLQKSIFRWPEQGCNLGITSTFH